MGFALFCAVSTGHGADKSATDLLFDTFFDTFFVSVGFGLTIKKRSYRVFQCGRSPLLAYLAATAPVPWRMPAKLHHHAYLVLYPTEHSLLALSASNSPLAYCT
jgi:hypothetical protein